MIKYDSYKDSGVEWIGDIPKHWGMKKVGYFSKLLTGNPWKSELFNFDDGIKIVRGENVSEGFLRWGDRSRYWTERVDNDSIFYLKDGDIVVSMDGSKVGKNFVQIREEDLPLLLHQRMCRVRINDNYHSKFVLYFIGSNMFRFYIDISKTDPMIPHITQKNIYDFKISIPPTNEQTPIVQYLDTKTNLIDTLIQKTKEKINLLQEKRTSLINHTVTKGLNPDVELKDSGVEWIGKIPKHWVKTKIKTISSVISKGTTPSTIGKDVSDEGEIRYLKSENIVDNSLSKIPQFFIDNETNEILKRSILYEGDILFVIAGASIGKTTILTKEFSPSNTNQAVSFIRLKSNENNRFVWYWLTSTKIQEQMWIVSVQSAQPNLSMENLGNFFIPYPPQNEQHQIVKFLDEEIQLIDSLIYKEEKRIELLKEYRQTLISNVVTGKIKVTDHE